MMGSGGGAGAVQNGRRCKLSFTATIKKRGGGGGFSHGKRGEVQKVLR